MKKSSLFLLIPLFLFACVSEEKNDSSRETTKKTDVRSSDSSESVSNLEKTPNDSNFLSGDIIFQTSFGHQSDLVSLITQSPFTHCGIISNQKGKLFVLEAGSIVKMTPFNEWIAGGKDSKYVVMRLKEYQKFLNVTNPKKTKKIVGKYLSKSYDPQFLWSDDKIYCSELVWKITKENIDLELCPLKKLKDYDLSAAEVQAELKKRYGDAIPNEESVVAPADLAASDLLMMIYSNY